jgi:hypothetical protein
MRRSSSADGLGGLSVRLSGNFDQMFCLSEHDASSTDCSARVAFGLLHGGFKPVEATRVTLRRLQDAATSALANGFGPQALGKLPEADQLRWKTGLQTVLACVNGLLSSTVTRDHPASAMLQAEMGNVEAARVEWARAYWAGFDHAMKELASTNARRLKMAVKETEAAFEERGIERSEHFHNAQRLLQEILGDPVGESCAFAWCMAGMIDLWIDAELGEPERDFGTALRRLRIVENGISSVCLRARSYIKRLRGDDSLAVVDMMRVLEGSRDPDCAIEALASAIKLQNGPLALRLVNACVERSPLWAIMIIGDPALAPAHLAAAKAFDRSGDWLRGMVASEAAACEKVVEKIRKAEEMTGVDLGPAIARATPTEAHRESLRTGGSLALYGLRTTLKENQIAAEGLARRMIEDHIAELERAIEVRKVDERRMREQHAAEAREARNWLDDEITRIQRRLGVDKAMRPFSETSSTRLFMLSCAVFIGYVCVGAWMAMRGVSPNVTRPFSIIGLVASVIPALQVIVRQANYSLREWFSEAAIRGAIKGAQKEYIDRIEAIESGIQRNLVGVQGDFEQLSNDLRKSNEVLKAFRTADPHSKGSAERKLAPAA